MIGVGIGELISVWVEVEEGEWWELEEIFLEDEDGKLRVCDNEWDDLEVMGVVNCGMDGIELW